MSECKFKVGDKGKTRGGVDYEVEWVGRPCISGYRILARLTTGGLESLHLYLANGRMLESRTEPHELLPPVRTVRRQLSVCSDQQGVTFTHGYVSEQPIEFDMSGGKIVAVRLIDDDSD